MNIQGAIQEHHFDDRIHLYQMNCMDLLKQTPDLYFSLAIIDCPYGIGESGGKKRSRGSDKIDYPKKDWDKEPPHSEYFKELFRVSKNQIIWGANHFISRLPSDVIDTPCWIIWDKVDHGSDFADFEMAWTSFDRATKSFRYSRQRNQNRSGNPRIHPTQKPIKLYSWILEHFAEKDFKILDTHLGSNSIGIASHYFGCELFGCEIDKDYFNGGIKRFKEQTQQLILMDK